MYRLNFGYGLNFVKWLKDIMTLCPKFQPFGFKIVKTFFGFLIENLLIPMYDGLDFVTWLQYIFFNHFPNFKLFCSKMAKSLEKD